MFKKLIKNKKAQNTAEYAILISLVVAGIIAMQTYAQRALQARVRDAGQYLATQTSDLGTVNQYEPYYLSTDYTVTRSEFEQKELGLNKVEQSGNTVRIRAAGGIQKSTYDSSLGLINGL